MPLIVIPKTYQDGDVLFEADLDNLKDAVETFLNATKLDDDNYQDDGMSISKLTPAARGFFVPTGGMIDFAGAAAPTGWLFADGSAVSRTTYADLFAALGTTWGSGNGTTTFNLPDRRGNSSLGVNDATLPAGRNMSLSERNITDAGGEETHVLTTTETPAHRHTLDNDTAAFTSAPSTATDGGHVHNVYVSSSANVGSGFQSLQRETNISAGEFAASAVLTGKTGSAAGANSGTHDHSITAAALNAAQGTHNHGGLTGYTGSDTAHNNMQPYVSCYVIIKT